MPCSCLPSRQDQLLHSYLSFECKHNPRISRSCLVIADTNHIIHSYTLTPYMPCSCLPSRQDQLLHWCPCLNANTTHASRARALSMQTQITSNTLTFIRHKCRVLAFPLDKTSFCIHVPVWMQTQLTHLALVPCQCRHKSHQTLLHSYAINAVFLPSL